MVDLLEFEKGARAVDILCGRSSASYTGEQYKEALHYVKYSPLRMHMWEQCLRHQQGKATEPYYPDYHVSREHERELNRDGWMVMRNRTFFGFLNGSISVHKAPYV